jgi:hypothetical protein
MTSSEYSLPVKDKNDVRHKVEGFATPKQDAQLQCARIAPKRVLPIIFLPGIMGSNLRMSKERQEELGRKDNIAWRPDSLGASNIKKNANIKPRERQLQLDPLQTTVDIYNPYDTAGQSGDERHSNVKLDPRYRSPTLKDDLPGVKDGRTALQKARERGWGEVFYGSYGKMLQNFEVCFNNMFTDSGNLGWRWESVVGIDPQVWGADPHAQQRPLTKDELRSVATGCWFPVFAFGYNWLQSNGDSAKAIAKRISKVIDDFKRSGYECHQVVVVTHSMGGLVGRGLVHPDYGNLQEKILGMVHGVMPAIGAPAAYKRIRAGFEDPGVMCGPEESLAAKVAGNTGKEVTAVLANSPGALQLLPTQSYGNGWLRVIHRGHNLESWPKHGDPYEEIYKVRNKWYALFIEEWINPSKSKPRDGGGTFERTCLYVDKAKTFHAAIQKTYHPNSFAHYGVDRDRLSFGEVVWEISPYCPNTSGWKSWPILKDDLRGKIKLVEGGINETQLPFGDNMDAPPVFASIVPASMPGDQTVPAKSADHQLESRIFKGIFRQNGYEHQSSCKDSKAVASMLYSIVRIAQKANWKC